jgi:hypothetical protein
MLSEVWVCPLWTLRLTDGVSIVRVLAGLRFGVLFGVARLGLPGVGVALAAPLGLSV